MQIRRASGLGQGRTQRLIASTVVATIAGAVSLSVLAASTVEASDRKRRGAPIIMAVTVDDLPAIGETDEWPKARILEAILDALRRHRVPAPVGFLCGSNLDDLPATREALQHWLEAGFVLGNHTYSHVSAGQVSPGQFELDIERGRALIRDIVEEPQASQYFRYPYLERGTGQDDVRIRQYLRQHHYRIADVSVDFADWAFAEAYGRCVAKDEQGALTALRDTYLSYALAELSWAQSSAQRLVGRPIAHVLLIHANLMTAQLLDALLGSYERAGVRFVTLEQALRDGVYALAQSARHGDGSLIAALARERRVHLASYAPLPRSLLAALCQ